MSMSSVVLAYQHIYADAIVSSIARQIFQLLIKTTNLTNVPVHRKSSLNTRDSKYHPPTSRPTSLPMMTLSILG